MTAPKLDITQHHSHQRKTFLDTRGEGLVQVYVQVVTSPFIRTIISGWSIVGKALMCLHDKPGHKAGSYLYCISAPLAESLVRTRRVMAHPPVESLPSITKSELVDRGTFSPLSTWRHDRTTSSVPWQIPMPRFCALFWIRVRRGRNVTIRIV
jgi:hypothetical protein